MQYLVQTLAADAIASSSLQLLLFRESPLLAVTQEIVALGRPLPTCFEQHDEE